MLTLDEIEVICNTPGELKKNWDEVVDSALKLVGAVEMTPEDKEHIENTK